MKYLCFYLKDENLLTNNQITLKKIKNNMFKKYAFKLDLKSGAKV